ncbi:MAG: FMN-binding protein [Oscillospiraceae bacterium]|nr:FMN-binding protein [Candidatus Equicaccousia limihippi]
MDKNIIKPIVVLFAICLVASVVLGFTNFLTADTIEKRELDAQNEALHLVLDAKDYKPVEVQGHPDSAVFKAVDGDQTVGYCFVETKKGYGGDVKTVVGVKGGKVTAATVTDVSNETAGIGKKVANSDFTSKFTGKSSADGVTAITGATFSSKAVKSAVAEALEIYGEVADGE